MEEIVRVKVAGTQLALTKGAYAVLSHFLDNTAKAYANSPTKNELVEQTESRIVTSLLERQSASMVVERGVMEIVVASVGYPEGYTPTGSPEEVKIPYTTPHTPTTPATPTRKVGPLGQIFIVVGKVILGFMLAGWLLTALCLIIAFVTLMAIGDMWADYLALPLEGMSPVVFAGLVCAVIALFMGIVGDLGFRLIAGRKVNFRKLFAGGIIWLIFFLWLLFSTVRNADEWVIWANETELKMEQHEREFEEWEESFDEQWERAVLDMTTEGDLNTSATFELDGFEGAMRWEHICDSFEELDPYEDKIQALLLSGKKATVEISNTIENGVMMRTILLTTPSGTTTLKNSVEGCTGSHIEIDNQQI